MTNAIERLKELVRLADSHDADDTLNWTGHTLKYYRPAVAKLLEVVEAAQTVANMVSKGSIRPDTYIHEKETQEFAWNALERLDAALRNLETKETEDA